MRQILLSTLRPGHHPDAPAGVVNVRKANRDAGLEALAASILSLGLLQPLVVVVLGAWAYVVDGNRRFAALESLLVAGKITSDYEVPVIERDAETAREAGLAANVTQAPMHEADLMLAFAELRKAGLKEKDIALKFSVPVAQVKKALALGGVSPAVLDAWRDGKVRVEAVQAFTLASHADQDRALAKVLKDGAHWRVREYLGPTDDVGHLISYVGVKAYKAAGGSVTEDLFGSRDAVSDPALLKRLADERLDAECERRRRDGWGWVAKADDLPTAWMWSWPRLKPGSRPLAAAEQARLDEINAFLDGEGDDVTDEEVSAAHAEADAIQAGNSIPLGAEDRARSGLVVRLGRDGKVSVEEYIVRPEDVPAAPKPDADPAPAAEPEEKGLPVSLIETLCGTATEAVQATLASSPTAGLVALLAGSMTKDHWAAPMKVRLDGVGGQRASIDDKEPFHALVARLSAMSVDELLVVAAGVAARGVQTLHREQGSKPRPPSERPSVLALMGLPDPAAMEAELRARFDGEAFFKSAPKGVTVGIVTEILGEAEGRRAAAMKKGDLVAYAVASVLPTGWLPAELRHPGYAGPGAAVAPAEVRAAA